MDERRRFERKQAAVRVEMRHPAFGKIVGFAKDISDGGAQVTIESMIFPPVGTVVDVMLKKTVDKINAEPVKMKVMHSDKGIIGLMFVPR